MRRAIIAGCMLTLVRLTAADLSPEELRGREIYRNGTSPSGAQITALVGGGATQVDAKEFSCAGCHGLDGRGRAEGGIAPPPIRWEDLERRRPPYSERMLIRALTLGLDPAGARLKDSMPRFALTAADARDLVAYLKRIASDHDPGISDDAVRVGVLLPPAGAVIRAALVEYFAESNRRGGVYGRRIELVFAEASVTTLADFLRRETVFALLSTYIAGAENEAAPLLAAERIPVVGAWTLLPDSRTDPFVFYLDSGLPGQAAALAEFALAKFAGSSRLALLDQPDELSAVAAAVVRSRIVAPHLLNEPRGDAVFLLLREREAIDFLRLSKTDQWRPAILIPGALATTAVLRELRSYSAPVYLAMPVAAQSKAQAEAAILSEALKRAGRELSREGVIHSLEGFYDFAPGFGPSVTFGPHRRIGSESFAIMRLDPKTGGFVDATK